MSAALSRILPSLVCPQCKRVGFAGHDPRCAGCGAPLVKRGGWLDFAGGPEPEVLLGQRFFMTAVGGRVYQALRERALSRLVTGKSPERERQFFRDELPLTDEGIVLDVPSGQGNFT